ncbi:MAG: HNH endonuclease [bacterium]|nr:HNH endonuclease [bacterium]
MAKKKAYPSQNLIRILFDYDNGQLIKRVRTGRSTHIGDIAGCINAEGYVSISVNTKPYYAHNLIWIYHHGDIPDELEVDHVDGNHSDNRIEKLRLLTPKENTQSRPKAKGYSWHKATNKWRAQIELDGKRHHLGLFTYEADARQCYLDAKSRIHIIKYHPSTKELMQEPTQLTDMVK